MYNSSGHTSSIICDTSGSLCNTNQCILKHLPLKKRFCSRKPAAFSRVTESVESRSSHKFCDYQLLPKLEAHRYHSDESSLLAHPLSYKFHPASAGEMAHNTTNALIVNDECHRMSKMQLAVNRVNAMTSLQVDRAEEYEEATSPTYSVQSSSGSQGKAHVSNRDQFYETCSTCSKTFYTENSFKIHLRRHLNKESGKYKCKVCGQTFSQRSGQVSHSRVHTREKPYLCDMCPKRFADFSTYTKHKRVHTGEKPYSCPCCHSSFSQSGNLHRHVRVVHKVQSTPGRN